MSSPNSAMPADGVSAQDEATMIKAAKEGCGRSMSALFTLYSPAIRAAASRFAPRLGLEDARQAAAVGFVNAVHAFDPTRPSGATRLAVLAPQYMTEELWAAVADNGAIRVPARSLKRYFQILRAAGGDLTRAEELAPRYDMRSETFASIAVAVNPGLSHDAEAQDRPAAVRYAAVEDQVLTAAALSSCSPDERAIVTLHYGLGSYDGLPLSEVAVQLGFSLRLTRKLHASALASARGALGVL